MWHLWHRFRPRKSPSFSTPEATLQWSQQPAQPGGAIDPSMASIQVGWRFIWSPTSAAASTSAWVAEGWPQAMFSSTNQLGNMMKTSWVTCPFINNSLKKKLAISARSDRNSWIFCTFRFPYLRCPGAPTAMLPRKSLGLCGTNPSCCLNQTRFKCRTSASKTMRSDPSERFRTLRLYRCYKWKCS